MNTQFIYPVIIREFHLDTFGHVNNATYFQLFEEARWELITQHGYGLKKVQTEQKGPVVLEANCKFLSELCLREKIEIVSTAEIKSEKIMHIRQKMMKEDKTLAADALFVAGLMDMKLRKLIPFTPDWLKGIGQEN